MAKKALQTDDFQEFSENGPHAAEGATDAKNESRDIFRERTEPASSNILSMDDHLNSEIAGVRNEVAAVLGGTPTQRAQRLIDVNTEENRRVLRKPGLGRRIWDFLSKTKEQRLRAHNARRERMMGASDPDATGELEARRNVGGALHTSPEAVWEDLHKLPKEQREGIVKTLKETLGEEPHKLAEAHPELVFALRFLLTNVGSHSATPATFDRLQFLKKALGIQEGDHVHKGASDYEKLKKGIEDKFAKINGLMTKLRGLVSEDETSDASYGKLKSIQREKKSAFHAAEDELARLQSAQKSKKERCDDFQQKFDAARGQVNVAEGLEQQLEKKEDELSNLNAQYARANRELQRAQEEYEAAKEKVPRTPEGLDDTSDASYEKLKDAERKKESALHAVEDERARLQSEKNAKERNCDALRQKLNTAKGQADTVDELKQNLEREKSGLASLNSQCDEAKTKFERAKSEHEEANGKMPDVEGCIKELRHLSCDFEVLVKDAYGYKRGEDLPADANKHAQAVAKFVSDLASDDKVGAAIKSFANLDFEEEVTKHVLPHAQKKIDEAKKHEAHGGGHGEAHGEHGEHEKKHMSPKELVQKLYYHFKITDQKDGGENPDGHTLTEVTKAKAAKHSVLFAQFSYVDAKMSRRTKRWENRLEEWAKKNLPSEERRGVLKTKGSMFLPSLESKLPDILKTFRLLEVDGKRPFAELNLVPKMTEAELRRAIKKGELPAEQIPLLIAYLDRLLEGYENKFLREHDQNAVLHLIRLLETVRAEEAYKKVRDSSGSFEDKLKELAKCDHEQDEDAKKRVNEEMLFDLITSKSARKEANQLIIDEARKNVTEGTWTVKEAMKHLKKNGIDAGWGTFAKLVAAKAGVNIMKAWRTDADKGLWPWFKNTLVKIKEAPGRFSAWFSDTNLGKAIDYSTSAEGWKFEPKKLPFVGGHGGHGGEEHGGGGSSGGAKGGGGHGGH